MRRFLVLAGVLAAGTMFVPTPVHAGGGCHGGGMPSGSGTTVGLAMNCMTPRVLHSSTGTVTFVNQDEVTHNLVGDTWGVDELRSGQEFTHDFAAGTHAYSCTLHPGMVGAVVVGGGETPLDLAASTSPDSDSGRLPLGLAVGAVAGIAATLGVRRLTQARKAASSA